MFDLVVIGDGSVGSYTAWRGVQEGLNVALIGNSDRSASLAAGAMNAVFGEVEHGFELNILHKEIFEAGLYSREKWMAYISQYMVNKAIVAEDTEIFLKNKASDFEIENYSEMKRIADKYGVIDHPRVTIAAKKLEDVIRLKGEFGFDPILLLKSIIFNAKNKGLVVFQDSVQSIQDHGSILVSLYTVGGFELLAKKVVIAAGAFSSKIGMPKEWNTVPIFPGVGTAIRFKGRHSEKEINETVIRSVNRGGAQCGVHCVPTPNGIYVGAGNYLTTSLDAGYKPETIRYLTSESGKDILGDKYTYTNQAEFTIGYRPRSLDGYPVVGKVSGDERVYYATGFNRIGYTIAPYVADLIINEIAGLGLMGIKTPQSWNPSRNLHTFGNFQDATDYYVSSRLANMYEHGQINLNDSESVNSHKEHLINVVKLINKQAVKASGFHQDFVFDPDVYPYLINTYNLQTIDFKNT